MTEDGTTGAPGPDPWRSPTPEPASPPERPEPPEAVWAAPSSDPGMPYGQAAPPVVGAWAPSPYPAPPVVSPGRPLLTIGLPVAAALLLVGVGTAAVLGDSPRLHPARDGRASASAAPSDSTAPAPVATVQPPGSAAGYKQLKGDEARSAIDDIRQELKSTSPVWRQNAKIALYAKGFDRLIFIGYSGAESPQLGRYLAGSPAAEVSLFFQSSDITGMKDYPAGTPDAVLRCGTYEEEGQPIAACAWADRSAMISLTAPGPSTKALATLTLKFRTASVHLTG